MLCVPPASALVAHCAIRELPVPLSATAEQPLIDAPPSLKLTVPVGAVPVTVAVKVTIAPNVEGFSELVRAVLDVEAFTTWANVELVDALLFASPL